MMLARTPMDEARAARALKAAKAFEFAKNNPAPSCKWIGRHQTSQYGNWCSLCGAEMSPPNPTWLRGKPIDQGITFKTAEVIDHPIMAELEIAAAWCRL